MSLIQSFHFNLNNITKNKENQTFNTVFVIIEFTDFSKDN